MEKLVNAKPKPEIVYFIVMRQLHVCCGSVRCSQWKAGRVLGMSLSLRLQVQFKAGAGPCLLLCVFRERILCPVRMTLVSL